MWDSVDGGWFEREVAVLQLKRKERVVWIVGWSKPLKRAIHGMTSSSDYRVGQLHGHVWE